MIHRIVTHRLLFVLLSLLLSAVCQLLFHFSGIDPLTLTFFYVYSYQYQRMPMTRRFIENLGVFLAIHIQWYIQLQRFFFTLTHAYWKVLNQQALLCGSISIFHFLSNGEVRSVELNMVLFHVSETSVKTMVHRSMQSWYDPPAVSL